MEKQQRRGAGIAVGDDKRLALASGDADMFVGDGPVFEERELALANEAFPSVVL